MKTELFAELKRSHRFTLFKKYRAFIFRLLIREYYLEFNK